MSTAKWQNIAGSKNFFIGGPLNFFVLFSNFDEFLKKDVYFIFARTNYIDIESFLTESANCSGAWGIAISIIDPGSHPRNSIFISHMNSHLLTSPGIGRTLCPPGRFHALTALEVP